ncbi:uncharacterized protein A1O9_00258 [Exophiala aquamarina CBS 119918]|uniref:Major facilitator superfamily (MFS) profile domain-containing protein n=1 Tax=Exophiala aquamarina CBS 119918 TaxID=1182545 RepID=A0A072PR21_9EURO|nr:uncharacterized protein A1O9_00258 [Exophiala aquamarina CBS 119918]KEF62286.1 hypothetical protein A1O9_00258 [Exophiala aquamarina CBS 119918]
MAFGVLQSEKVPFPVGTVLLESTTSASSTLGALGKINLSPLPSSSPRDPLNWSKVRKELFFLVIIFGSCLNGVLGPVLVPAFGIIQTSLDISLTKVSLLNGALIMGLGLSSYLYPILATVVGKRPVFLLTSVILVASSCWGGGAKSYSSLLGARTVQGLGMGSFLSLSGTASINDVFFVHERGFRVGLWNAAVIVSINVAPIISSRIIVACGWRWAFWILAISFGVLVGATLVGMPETSFDRNGIEGEVVVGNEDPDAAKLSERNATKSGFGEDSATIQSSLPPVREIGKLEMLPITFQSTLHPCPASQGSFKDAGLSMIRALRLLRHPATIWACIIWSVMFSWVIILGVVASQIFAAPPYNMTPTAVGNLIGIPPLIGSLLGTVLGGYFCDFVALRLSHQNGGVYEPEFRLWTIFVSCIVPLAVGVFGLGQAISNGSSAIVCGFFLASLNFAIGTGCTTIVAYSNDVFGDEAGEVFGLAMLVKSSFAFGLTFMLNDYYAFHGPRGFFFTWGSLSLGLTLFGTIPMYIYGKRARAWAK